MSNGSVPTSASSNGTHEVVEVLRLKSQSHQDVIALTSSYGGCFVHYVKKEGHYCAGENCPRELHRVQGQYRAYAAVLAWFELEKRWRTRVFEIVPSAEQLLGERWARGSVWRFFREKENRGKRSPVSATLLGHIEEVSLPSPFSVQPILARLFGVDAIDLTAKNPLAPRVFVPVFEGSLKDSFKKLAE